MATRHILMIDGEPLRKPGLEAAFPSPEWHLHWTTLLQIQLDFMPETTPDVVVLGPSALMTDEGVVQECRQKFPAAQMVVALNQPGTPLPAGATAALHLGDAPAAWREALGEGGLPESRPTTRVSDHPLTSDDIFGDIVAGLEGEGAVEDRVFAFGKDATPPPAPKPAAPPPPAPVAPAVPKPVPPPPPPPAPAPAPAPKAPVKPVLQDPPTLPASEAPLNRELQDLLGDFFAPTPARAVPPKKEEDFTLSGISGIHDPFGALPEPKHVASSVPEPPRQEAPKPAPVPVPVSPAPVPAPAPAPAPAALMDSQQMPILDEFGNYYLLEKIAVGGMAELFKARQRGVHDFQKIVAIKRILPHLSDNDEFVRMFIDEAKLAAQLTHPNIAQIFDLGKVSGFYYIAMEYVDGRDLRSMLRRVREFKVPFPEVMAAFITMKVAGALDYAHRKRGMDDKELKLVHRDISPQNVLVSSEGAVKLVDFGIAKAATKSTQTVAGALKGKLLYMSPEQALGQSLDHRSDIYSLGLVLFELLTGERCFQADSELGVLEKVRLGKVLDIKSINPLVSDEMVTILRRALEKDVDRRYGSARMMERDLKALLVRQGNDPVEHDMAEFANVLLKGTKEQLELLIATRFPPVTSSPKPQEPAKPIREVSKPRPAASVMAPQVPLPPPPDGMDSAIPTQERPKWLIPAVVVGLGVIIAVLWIALR